MLVFVYEDKIDERVTLATHVDSQFRRALQWDPENNSFEWVPVDDLDGDYKLAHIEYEDDDLIEKGLEMYRWNRRDVIPNDTIEIVSGRKMLGEIKTVKATFEYRSQYMKHYQAPIEYISFTDGTKVQKQHIKIIDSEYFRKEGDDEK